MKIPYPTVAEAEAAAIRCILPIRYDEDREELAELLTCFPGLRGKTLTLTLDIDTATVRDWPSGREADIHLKVVDEGVYELLDASGAVLRRLEYYVPCCIPGEYGDYVVMTIRADGKIAGWRPCASDIADCFWSRDGDGWTP